MRLKITFILLIQVLLLNAQLSQKVRELAKPLDTISYAESSHTGFGGEKSKLYDYFRNLSKIAKNDELYYLAKNGSNSLRFYSSQELFKRNDKRFLEIYTFYYHNPIVMKYTMGCIGKSESIASYFKNEVKSAKEIISLRDSILIEKREGVAKRQLKSIKEEGYDKLTQKNIEFYLKEIEKIDSKK